MSKKFLLIFLFILLFTNFINAENIYLSTRTTFGISQFWEQQFEVNDGYREVTRHAFSQFLSGTMGIGFEMVIWDMTKKRGSRLYWKAGVDLLMGGFSNAGYYNTNTIDKSMKALSLNGGAFYTGIGWDIFVGGTFPKTDIIWGFGSIFNFYFPSYASELDVNSFVEKFAFYAVPSVLIGYDIMLPALKMKITPQIRTGFTCNPFIPDDLIRDTTITNLGSIIPASIYIDSSKMSGFYFDFSVAFSFFSVAWK